mmetsp:Transcript_13532/g.29102  ORF Transcript_13532/g.29102 Transcript_13532/m.29102 type:complete len:90 (-) Transcript_13532:8-277(-)
MGNVAQNLWPPHWCKMLPETYAPRTECEMLQAQTRTSNRFGVGVGHMNLLTDDVSRCILGLYSSQGVDLSARASQRVFMLRESSKFTMC